MSKITRQCDHWVVDVKWNAKHKYWEVYLSHYFTCFTITYTLTDKTEARAYGFLNYPKFCPFTYVEDCMWKWSHHSEINIDSCTENVAEVQKDSEHSRLLKNCWSSAEKVSVFVSVYQMWKCSKHYSQRLRHLDHSLTQFSLLWINYFIRGLQMDSQSSYLLLLIPAACALHKKAVRSILINVCLFLSS